jgi:hypothetical protein
MIEGSTPGIWIWPTLLALILGAALACSLLAGRELSYALERGRLNIYLFRRWRIFSMSVLEIEQVEVGRWSSFRREIPLGWGWRSPAVRIFSNRRYLSGVRKVYLLFPPDSQAFADAIQASRSEVRRKGVLIP